MPAELPANQTPKERKQLHSTHSTNLRCVACWIPIPTAATARPEPARASSFLSASLPLEALTFSRSRPPPDRRPSLRQPCASHSFPTLLSPLLVQASDLFSPPLALLCVISLPGHSFSAEPDTLPFLHCPESNGCCIQHRLRGLLFSIIS